MRRCTVLLLVILLAFSTVLTSCGKPRGSSEGYRAPDGNSGTGQTASGGGDGPGGLPSGPASPGVGVPSGSPAPPGTPGGDAKTLEIAAFQLLDPSSGVGVIEGLPKYLLAKGWLSQRLALGMTGTNPIRFNVDTGSYWALGLTAWDISSSSDGSWVSYLKEDGVWVARADGKSAKRLWPAQWPPAGGEQAGDGNPGGGIWSPDGGRLLVWYQHEWDADFFVVDSSGQEKRLATRLDDYFLTSPVGWLDAERLVFTTRAAAKKDGTGEYSHGYRSDVAVYDLRDDSYRLITDAEDGEFIEGLSAGSRGIIFQRRREAGKPSTLGVMDATGKVEWEEAFGNVINPSFSSNGDLAYVVTGGKIDERNHEYRLVVHSCGSRSEVAKLIVGDHLSGPFWSPDGRELLLSFSYGAPAGTGYHDRYVTLTIRPSGFT